MAGQSNAAACLNYYDPPYWNPEFLAWQFYVFQGANEARTISLWNNQNRIGAKVNPSAETCLFTSARNESEEFSNNVEASEVLTPKFSIRGGSDCPRLILSLKIKTPSLTTSMEVVFLQWSHGLLTHTPRELARLGRHEPKPTPHTFSDILKEVIFDMNYSFGSVSIQDLQFDCLDTGRSPKAVVSFTYQHPICIHIRRQIPGLSPSDAIIVDNFRRLQSASRVFIVVKASQNLVEAFNHFAATPVPTPPPFHRYARKLVPGQSCVEDDAFSSPSIAPMGPDTAVETFFRRRNKEWPADPPSWTVTEQKAWQGIPMPPPHQYLNERHCEVQVLGTLMREVLYAASHKGASHDGRYDFDLEPVESGVYQYEHTFKITLTLRGSLRHRAPVPAPGCPVRLQVHYKRSQTASSKILKGVIRKEKTSKEVFTTIDGPFEDQQSKEQLFIGRVIYAPNLTENQIELCVHRHGFLTGHALEGLSGRFWFGHQGDMKFVDLRKSLRILLYPQPNVQRDPFLKDLLFCHYVPTQGLRPPTPQHPELLQGTTLNQQQLLVLQRCVTTANTFGDRLVICQGPPGSGKTRVISELCGYNLQVRVKTLLSCATNEALDVCASAVRLWLKSHTITPPKIYRIQTDTLENIRRLIDDDMTELTGRLLIDDPPRRSSSNSTSTVIDNGLRTNIEKYLVDQVKDDPLREFSLANHIIARMKFMQAGAKAEAPQHKELREEQAMLRTLLSARESLRLWTKGEADDEDDTGTSPAARFDSCWLSTMRYYIERADLILCTSSMASSRPVQIYRPLHIVLDECSQLKEYEFINATARFSTLRKLSMFGDQCQLGPSEIAASQSEFSSQSILERLIHNGHEPIVLNIQYRMHPQIASFISSSFYQSQLLNHPSTATRQSDAQFAAYSSRSLGKTGRHTIFVDLQGHGKLFRETQGTSLINPHSLTAVTLNVQGLLRSGFPPSSIMVIVYYSAQVKLASNWLHKKTGVVIRVHSVNGSQGKEAQVVIVDTVTPGGRYPLDFVADKKRMNVALSRAQSGRIIIGNARMADNTYPSAATDLWRTLSREHQQNLALWPTTVNDQPTRQELSIPGPDFSDYFEDHEG